MKLRMREAIVVTWGACAVCVWPFSYDREIYLLNTYLPMPEHALMSIDSAQSSVRASKSSAGEENSHWNKLPKEGTNVPPIGILKGSPMLSGNQPGRLTQVKITRFQKG